MKSEKVEISEQVSAITMKRLNGILCLALLSGLSACGWLKPPVGNPAVHEHGPGCNHGAEVHADHDNDHRMYGGWDTTEYPSAANLYRAMHLIDALKDTSDKGFPTHAEMFVATFSEEYIRYKPDSATMKALALALKQQTLEVRFSGAAWDDATKQYLPRLARVLDLLRSDSSNFHYRARSINGYWVYEGLTDAQWTTDTLYPTAQLKPRNRPTVYRRDASLSRPEKFLFESLSQ